MKSDSIEIHYISKREMDGLRERFSIDHNPSVLSFSYREEFPAPDNCPSALGEVFLCSYYAAREAKGLGCTYGDHEARLVAHGVLHCLGYDHGTKRDVKRMEKIEKRIFKG